MVTRFVYPTTGFWGKECLHITSTSDDGQLWLGISDAIKNYCNSAGLEVKNVEWKVKFRSEFLEYTTIVANTPKQWEKKYKAEKEKLERMVSK